MQIGTQTRWLFARDFKEGDQLYGEFTHTSKTEKGHEYVVFVANDGVEYQIFPSLLVSKIKFEPKGQKAYLTKKGSRFEVLLESTS